MSKTQPKRVALAKRGALARITSVQILDQMVPVAEQLTDHDPDAVDALAEAMVPDHTGWPEVRCDEILQALYVAGWALVRLDAKQDGP